VNQAIQATAIGTSNQIVSVANCRWTAAQRTGNRKLKSALRQANALLGGGSRVMFAVGKPRITARQ